MIGNFQFWSKSEAKYFSAWRRSVGYDDKKKNILTKELAKIGNYLPPAFCSLASFPPCPMNFRVGANSPNLCPTIASVTKTSR